LKSLESLCKRLAEPHNLGVGWGEHVIEYYMHCEEFARLDEHAFAGRDSDVAARPNVPVNALVGLEALTAGFDWSDAALHDAFTFNVQVRCAAGDENLGNGNVDLRAVYHFRCWLSDHHPATGENLLEQAFAPTGCPTHPIREAGARWAKVLGQDVAISDR